MVFGLEKESILHPALINGLTYRGFILHQRRPQYKIGASNLYAKTAKTGMGSKIGKK